MRLIDADALCDRFSEIEDLNPTDGNNGYLNIEEIYEVIDNAPTVERPQTISCFNCKHDDKSAIEDPCKYCNNKFSEWQAKGGEE